MLLLPPPAILSNTVAADVASGALEVVQLALP